MQPVRLRPVINDRIGTTAFFRNRVLLETVNQELICNKSEDVTVLFHSCSVGAEVFSFIISFMLNPLLNERTLTVHALDIEPHFLFFAERAVYPKDILIGMKKQEVIFFECVDDENVRPIKEVRDKVKFLSAGSFSSFGAECEYDVVFIMNSLLYVPSEEQSLVFDRIANYNKCHLITTGFHQDKIKDDLTRNGYAPVHHNMIGIHDGWLDRRLPQTNSSEIIPGKVYHTWSLPPFQEIDDYEYKFCSIFKKI